MDPKRVTEIANDCLKEIHPGIDGRGSNMHKAIEAAILQALREALGPATPEMVKAGIDVWYDKCLGIEAIFNAMAAVRLRGMTGGGASNG